MRLLTLALSLIGLPAFALAAGMNLAGTSWQLLSIQSMDDAQGTIQIAEPDHFTLEFGGNGRATLRLGCNRAMGDYTAEPAGDNASGALTFASITATRALCPPPHLDQRIARDLAYVRSYFFRHGKLYLTLLADGGIYEWKPTAVTGEDPNRTIKPLRFHNGKRSATIRGHIVGRQYLDFQLRAKAGQRVTIRLDGSNNANYFNLLSPAPHNEALAIGERLDNRYQGILPENGIYTIRVFLYRSAARRNERSAFTLSVGIDDPATVPPPSRIQTPPAPPVP